MTFWLSYIDRFVTNSFYLVFSDIAVASIKGCFPDLFIHLYLPGAFLL